MSRRRCGRTADPSAYRAALERTIEESDGLIRIFDALLMIARAEAGADRAGMSAFDVGEVVTGASELYEPVAEEKGFEMTVAVSPGLTMTGNRELIGQAIANLIDNALKYGAADLGRARPRSDVVARREGSQIRRRGRRSRIRNQQCRSPARLRSFRAARGRAFAPRFRARPVARRGGGAPAWRGRAARGQRAGVESRRHSSRARIPRSRRRPRRRRRPSERARGPHRRGSARRSDRHRAPAPGGPDPRTPGFASARQIAGAAPIRDLLLGIADHSPYLWSLATEDPARLARLLLRSPEDSLDALDRGVDGASRRGRIRNDAGAAPRQTRIRAARGARRYRRRLGPGRDDRSPDAFRRCGRLGRAALSAAARGASRDG